MNYKSIQPHIRKRERKSDYVD
uniref:Uncharacterized protein n=1 Tax=Anguilla anguilla TaxID=7936 RepID=A0A0E9XWE7_ANGAN